MSDGDIPDKNQEEHELISTSLDVEQLDTNLFRSRQLFVPRRARGVFGGQVISQAVVSATKCIEEQYKLHSLHCYFILSAKPSVPILYYVEVLRVGRTYTTCSVKAVQYGRNVFFMMCSFQVPETIQPSHQMPVPVDVPQPEECLLEEEIIAQRLAEITDSKQREVLELRIMDRKRSPIAIKHMQKRVSEDGTVTYMYWMKAKNIPKYNSAYQKCILAYVSDLNFIGSASRSLGLTWGGDGPNNVAMQSSLDHSLYFYDHDFDHGEWMLYVYISPRTGLGRGIALGRIYDRKGRLCAIAGQEGVIRAHVEKKDSSVQSKL